MTDRRSSPATLGFGAIAFAFLLAMSPETSSAEDLTELSLEELLETELDRMAVTGIHHTHERGEWMVGYRFMYMRMDGNRDGTHDRTTASVFADGFSVTPTDMNMEMHMFHVMYGMTDDLTAMLMVPYIRKSMDHIRIDGLRFTTRSQGIGDVSLRGLYSLLESDNHQLIAVGGLSFPTGSIDESDKLPGMAPGMSARLPYPMQLGSGTWDLLPGLTYIGQVPSWQWGVHGSGTLRFGKNEHDYRLGNRYESTVWAARKITAWSSGSLRLLWGHWMNIHGADPSLNPAMVPTADPDRRAGQRLDLLFGVNLFATTGRLGGLRGAVEGGIPVYQRLDGPQLETDWTLSGTLEWTF
ncbi:MAG: transporter [Myxococcota bacterium]